MTADELLERSSSRLLTEYQILFEIKDEEADERKAREAIIEAAEEADRGVVDRVDDDDESEGEGEPDEPDDLSPEDMQRMIDEQRALIARALAGPQIDG